MTTIIDAKFILRAATASDWASANPVLDANEPAVESDTGRFKIGNGSTTWNALTYATDLAKTVNSSASGGKHTISTAERSAINARHSTPGAAPHTSYLQGIIDAAQAAGIYDVTIPPLDPTDATVPWVINARLTCFAGLRIHAGAAAIKQTTLGEPAFYIPPNVDGVHIDVGDCYMQLDPATGNRYVWAEFNDTTVNGTRNSAYVTGVMSWGSRAKITGKFRNWRNGVRLGNWSGTGSTFSGFREANYIRIEVADVDFGLVYFGQKHLDADVQGSYAATSGTPDPPHLIYSTDGATTSTPSTDCRVTGNAWSGADGGAPTTDDDLSYAFQFKGQIGLFCPHLKASGVGGVLHVYNPQGDAVFGEIIGTGITAAGVGGAGAIRGAGTSANGAKQVGSVRIEFAPTVAVADMRALSLNDDWAVDDITVVTNTNSTSTAQTLVYVSGNRSTLGKIHTRNKGTGGVQGIRYLDGTTGHRLTQAPSLSGVTNGVVVDNTSLNVTDSVLTVDLSAISTIDPATYSRLDWKPNNSIVLRTGAAMVAPVRVNRFYATPPGVLSDITPGLNNLYAYPWVIQERMQISAVGVNVRTAVASAVLRLGLYYDFGNGLPGGLLTEFGTIDGSVTNTGATITLGATLTLRPATYWIGFVPQGASGAIYRGVASSQLIVPVTDMVSAIAGGIPYHSGVTGALPTSFTAAGISTSIGALRLGFNVPLAS